MADRRPRDLSDEELLGLLAQTLAPPGSEPSARSVAEIRMAVRTMRPDGPRPGPRRPTWGRSWWAPVVVVGGLVTGVGSAYAAGVPVQKPFRALAAEAGLSQAPAQAQQPARPIDTRRGHRGDGSAGHSFEHGPPASNAVSFDDPFWSLGHDLFVPMSGGSTFAASAAPRTSEPNPVVRDEVRGHGAQSRYHRVAPTTRTRHSKDGGRGHRRRARHPWTTEKTT